MSAPNSRGLPSGPIPSTRTMIRRASTVSTMPSRLQRTTAPGVAGDDALEARADDRRLGPEERHRLALHVRAHEGPVRVVVLEEGDERRRDGDELLRRDVHELDLVPLARALNSPLERST